MSQRMRSAGIVLAVAAVVASSGTPTATAAVEEPPIALFAPATGGVGGWVAATTVGEFTGDAKDDVVAAFTERVDIHDDIYDANQQFKLAVATSPPDGFLTHAQEMDIEPRGNRPTGMTSGDVDGDGDRDVVLVTQAGIDVYRQQASRLQPPDRMDSSDGYYPELGDLDGDGRLDLVLSGGSAVYFRAGAGDGTFGAPQPFANLRAAFAIGDVTGDGRDDAVAALGRTVYVFSRDAGGSFASTEYQVVASDDSDAGGVAIGDFNGDGRSDVAIHTGRVSVLPQTANGTLGTPLVTDAPWSGGPIAAADINLDGRTDVLANFGRTIGVFAQDASGRLREVPRQFELSGYTQGVAVADVTGDGFPDILARGEWAGVLVLRAASGLQSWGLNNWRQLGSPLTYPFTAPWGPIEVTDEVSVAAGAAHSLAVTSLAGRVYSWGMNELGQMGVGDRRPRFNPSYVTAGMRKVAAGGLHSLALSDTGVVFTWGWNAFGQLGVGTSADADRPVRVPGLDHVVEIAGGVTHSLAVTAAGEVWAWGLNHVGQLGTGSTASSLVPVRVPGLSNVVAVSAGHFHSLALTRDGKVWAWGFNDYGQLGTGSQALYEPTPRPVASASPFLAVAAGGRHSIALVNDGSVRAWGLNNVGELGNGSTADSRVPVRVSSLSGVVGVAAGWYHSLAVKRDGSTWAWGWNHFGQLGLGMTSDVPVVLPLRVINLRRATALSGGLAHSLAITAPVS